EADAILGRLCKEVEQIRNDVVLRGDSVDGPVVAKLRLGLVELLRGLDARGRKTVFAAVGELLRVADGGVDPLRAELEALLRDTGPRPRRTQRLPTHPLWVAPQVDRPIAAGGHPLLDGCERHYARGPELGRQLDEDFLLASRAMDIWRRQRAAGDGTLHG